MSNFTSLSAVLLALALSGCAALSDPGLPEPTSERPRLGMRVRVTPATEVPAPIAAGRRHILTVVKVYEKDAAELAGIRPGDVLLALDNSPVTGLRDSFAVMQGKRWGEPVDITLYRNNEVQHVQVVTERPSVMPGS